MSETRNYCSICSLACPVILKGGRRGPVFKKDSILSLEWDTSEGSKYGGSLCARGNAIVELVSHPGRLNYASILGERSDVASAVKEVAKNLGEIKKATGPDSIGVLLGENLTNEEAAMAVKFAREAIGTSNIELFATEDIPVFDMWLSSDVSELKPSGPAPTGTKKTWLFFGDSFTEHPCTAKSVLAGKYSGRGNEIIVVAPEKSHTAWFATRHLWCNPGGEAAVAAGLLKAAAKKSSNGLTADLKRFVDGVEWIEIERISGVTRDVIESAAEVMLASAGVETYVSNIFGRFASPGLVTVLAEALTAICPGERKFEPQFVQQNSWGIYSVLAEAGAKPFMGKLESGEIKGLLILGLDLFSAFPAGPVEDALREKVFTAATQMFRGQTAERANVVIPAASLMEKKGTVSPSFDEDLERTDVIDPPGGAVSDAEFLAALAAEMGSELGETGAVARKTSRKASGDQLAGAWAGYSNLMKELDAAELVLIPKSEAVHAADGALSRNLHWSDVTCPEPMLSVSEELAADMNIEDGDKVKVSTEEGDVLLAVKKTSRLRGGTVAATIHFPSVRKLFPWKLEERRGRVIVAPVPVTLDRQDEKS